MKILAVNGSPQGSSSITLQTFLYLAALHKEHEFEVINAGQPDAAQKKDFPAALEKLKAADVIIFVYPVYTFLAPSQLQCFIEHLKENAECVRGKYASQITTSKHFYDVTAHSYIEENCMDMGMKCVPGLSADMNDLLTERGRREAESYFERLVFSVENGIARSRTEQDGSAVPPAPHLSALSEVQKKDGYDIALVHNAAPDDAELRAMIDAFARVMPHKVRGINIREYPFAGGCLGCFSCAADGECIYKDGFDSFLRNTIQTADAIVYAFTIENHYTHSSFKMFDDRQFCNGHRMVTSGKPVAYILSGRYSEEHNLQTLIEARSQVGGNFLAGVATDERDAADDILKLAKSLAFALEKQCISPRNFYGVGGAKIFRDLIYEMRGLMRADGKYYKEYGLYDFPQKKRKTILLMKLVGCLMSLPGARAKIRGNLGKYIIAPYKKVLEDAAKR